MQILIERISQEHIDATKIGSAENIYVPGAAEIDFRLMGGGINLKGNYTICADIGDMTINQIKGKVEEYIKEKMLK
jgi:hypothetical protein